MRNIFILVHDIMENLVFLGGRTHMGRRGWTRRCFGRLHLQEVFWLLEASINLAQDHYNTAHRHCAGAVYFWLVYYPIFCTPTVSDDIHTADGIR